MRRAGLEGYRLHDARHAHATMMIRQRVHPKVVQERLGHAKVGTKLDIYSHVTPGLPEAAALRFEEGCCLRDGGAYPEAQGEIAVTQAKEKAPETPWGHIVYLENGAEDGIRTHDPLLGKEMLYH